MLGRAKHPSDASRARPACLWHAWHQPRSGIPACICLRRKCLACRTCSARVYACRRVHSYDLICVVLICEVLVSAARLVGGVMSCCWCDAMPPSPCRSRCGPPGRTPAQPPRVRGSGRVGRESGQGEWAGRVGRESGQGEWAGRVGREDEAGVRHVSAGARRAQFVRRR